jgi:hypothetical protein
MARKKVRIEPSHINWPISKEEYERLMPMLTEVRYE